MDNNDKIIVAHITRNGTVERIPTDRIFTPVDTDRDRYNRYRPACDSEQLEPHPYQQWLIHGRPAGPLG